MREEGDKIRILTPPARRRRLLEWLRTAAPSHDGRLNPLTGDAGCRRYYRIMDGDHSRIAVDDAASAQRRRFVAVAAMFRGAGVIVPEVFAENDDDGFLLLEDFGDATFLSLLPDNADALRNAAFRALVNIQLSAAQLPPYDEALLRAEMALYGDWHCACHLRRPLSAAEADAVAHAADFLQEEMRAQPQTPTHRDYHSRNLMALPDGRSPGVLDFQDAVIGAAAYDIASLLRDAYIEWPAARQRAWLGEYWRLARAAGAPLPADENEYWRDFNVAGAQRGLKVLGIFARLACRDNKRQFIADMPVAHRHLLAACEALPALADLGEIVAARPPTAAGNVPCER